MLSLFFVRGVFLGMLCAPTACQSCNVFHRRREEVVLSRLFRAIRFRSVWIRMKVFCSPELKFFPHYGDPR